MATHFLKNQSLATSRLLQSSSCRARTSSSHSATTSASTGTAQGRMESVSEGMDVCLEVNDVRTRSVALVSVAESSGRDAVCLRCAGNNRHPHTCGKKRPKPTVERVERPKRGRDVAATSMTTDSVVVATSRTSTLSVHGAEDDAHPGVDATDGALVLQTNALVEGAADSGGAMPVRIADGAASIVTVRAWLARTTINELLLCCVPTLAARSRSLIHALTRTHALASSHAAI